MVHCSQVTRRTYGTQSGHDFVLEARLADVSAVSDEALEKAAHEATVIRAASHVRGLSRFGFRRAPLFLCEGLAAEASRRGRPN